MPNKLQEDYRDQALPGVAGGISDYKDAAAIAPNECEIASNVDFDRDSVRSARGILKFGNRPAPSTGILTRCDPALSPLSIAAGVSVPLRGYVQFPYNERTDIGGDFANNGALVGSQTFHTRRGRSFSVQASFTLDPTELLYDVQNGAASGAVVNAGDASVIQFLALGGYDEALEETSCVWQKGGDRLAPMSWAIALINTGDRFEYKTGQAAFDRPSNVAIAFMWLDVPEWGEFAPTTMRYKVGAGAQASIGTTGSYATFAYRCIIAKKFIEPGRSYHVSVDLSLDTGSVQSGGTVSDPTATWNADGTFKIVIATDDDAHPTVCETLGTDLFVWTGPSDSYDYLTRYGIRYSGRDATFGGLGYRFAPWNPAGFVPYGADSASLELGGFAMVPFADVAPPTGHTLTIAHTSGDAYVTVNHRSLINGNTNQKQNPTGVNTTSWQGLGNGVGTVYNPDSLKGCWLVPYGSGAVNTRLAGVRLLIGSYTEPGTFRADCGISSSTLTWAATAASVLAFRWHQRPLTIGEFGIFSAARDWTDSRNYVALLHGLDPLDATDSNAAKLIAAWPLDDAGGGVAREIVSGLDGFLAPFALGVSKTGTRGTNRLFLSGEGEALKLDFSTNPVLKRELQNMLRSGKAGLAIEVTLQMTEAYYAVAIGAGAGFYGKYAPAIATWEVRDQVQAGMTAHVHPLLDISHRCEWDSVALPERRPMGFMARALTKGDGEADTTSSRAMQRIVTHHTGVAFQWDTTAAWVGKTITLQVGIQPTGTDDNYKCYFAMTPKADGIAASGDPSGAELSFFSTTVTIRRRELVRSVITIGGRLNTGVVDSSGTQNFGYSEMNCRMLVDEVRVFATPGPGALAVTSGAAVLTRDGKLQGQKAYPNRELEVDDILRPLGEGQVSCNFSEGSASVAPVGSSRFFTGSPADTKDSIKGLFLYVPGDIFEQKSVETIVSRQAEFYFVSDVATNGSSLTLATPYNDIARSNAGARAFGIIAYTAFADDLYGRVLSVASGKSFVPGTTVASDVTMTADFFENLAPSGSHWGLRVYSPIGQASIDALVPKWVRGLKRRRRDPILGIRKQETDKLFVTRGAVFKADDRWRPDVPVDSLDAGLAFLARSLERANVALPLHDDYVRFADASTFALTVSNLNAGTLVYDAWVRFSKVFEYQTLLFVGSETSNPSSTAGTTAKTNFRVQLIVRLYQGRPQIVVGSSATYDGTNKPEKGLFVATGSQALKVGKWTHVRWILRSSSAGAVIEMPQLSVNGKATPSSTNAVENGLAGTQWLNVANVPALDANCVALVGVARDSFLVPETAPTYVEGSVKGTYTKPRRVHGFLHSLAGDVAGLVVSKESSSLSSTTAFDPTSVTYALPLFDILRPGRGVGHKVEDTVSGLFGVIHSHPFVSLFHELGMSERPAIFAQYENTTYLTNGERPVFVKAGISDHAGVLPPTTRPAFTIDRKPIWRENKVTVATDRDNDPISGAAVGAARIYGYSTYGNNYLTETFHDEMKWEADDYFCFKCLIRPRQVSGRTVICSARGELASGGLFIEIRDGKICVGWWDTVLKEEVTIQSNVAVFIPGLVHYVYVRKKHPNSGSPASYAGWKDSVYNETAGFAYDSIIVRAFMPEALNAALTNWPTWAAKHTPQVAAATRDCISFTADQFTVAGCTATGLVSDPDSTYTVATAAGVTTVTASAGTLHEGMHGMVFQFGAGAKVGISYRVKSLNPGANTFVIVDMVTGADLAFTDAVARVGGIFTGVRLQLSSNLSTSRNPDSAAYDFELFGSGLASQVFSGLSPLNADFWSFGYYVISDTNSQNVDIFEGNRPDEIETGTDNWAGSIFSATPPGELQFTSSFVFAFVDGNRYGRADAVDSTAPNEELEVALDSRGVPQPSNNAQSFFWRTLQEVNVLSGVRQVRVVFYDPAQNELSNPSPNLIIEPSAEDSSNPSGQARILLTDLPVSQDGPRIQRWVYMTLADQYDYHRVAIVPDNTSTSISIFQSEFQIATGIPIETDNAPPPRCDLIAVSQQSMFYGALVDQVDGVLWSKPYRPCAVPFSNFNQFAAGKSTRIRAMADFRNKLYVWKRDSMHALVVRYGAALPEDITEGEGCSSAASVQSLDNVLFWLSPRGVFVFTGAGVPTYAGINLQKFITEKLDPTMVENVISAINKRRSQYVAVVRSRGSDYTDERFACEYDHETSGVALGQKPPARFRFSRYEGAAVSALGAADPLDGSTEVLIGGSGEGFALWMDREDAALQMVGPDDVAGGVVTTNSSSTRILLVADADELDTEFGGPVGAVIEWDTGSGRILWCWRAADGTVIVYLDRALTGSTPVAGVDVDVGAVNFRWETGWLHLGSPHKHKTLSYLRPVFAKQDSTVRLRIYADRNTTTAQRDELLDLSSSVVRTSVGDIRGDLFKIVLESADPVELLAVIFSLNDEDQS